jgi:hypothetical protein
LASQERIIYECNGDIGKEEEITDVNLIIIIIIIVTLKINICKIWK